MDPRIKNIQIFAGWQTISMDGNTLRKLIYLGFNIIPTICKYSDDLWFSFIADRLGIPVDNSLGMTQQPGDKFPDNLAVAQDHCTTYVKCATEMLNYIITPYKCS
jgi:hypothetical protein